MFQRYFKHQKQKIRGDILAIKWRYSERILKKMAITYSAELVRSELGISESTRRRYDQITNASQAAGLKKKQKIWTSEQYEAYLKAMSKVRAVIVKS